MKIRDGFVSNSSSTAFIITNKTKESLPLVEFVIENRDLVKMYNDEYDANEKLGDMINAAEDEYEEVILKPGKQVVVFGDEQGNSLGRVYDYILRDGGNSERFKWQFKEYYR